MEGADLLRTLICATGLPENAVEGELNRLVEAHGLNVNTLDLDDIREILSLYLQDVLIEAKSTLGGQT